MLVDFMIIGAQKCATTTLAYQLSQHPKVNFWRLTEPHFFSVRADWREGLEEYHQLFDPAEGQLCGEASTSYTFLPEFEETHSRLFEYNPALRLIYLMRQPVERIVSQYAHDLRHFRLKRPQDVLSDPMYVNRSRYGVQIRPYLDLFPKEQISLIIFEEFVADPVKTLAEMATFLGIPHAGFATVDTSPQHESEGLAHPRGVPGARLAARVLRRTPAPVRSVGETYLFENRKPDFPDSLKQSLWPFVKDDVRAIEELIGRRLDEWRRGYSE